ncbi:MAG: hypothetical protein HY084_05255 [Gemmatimonadetes bacterium]|nr:hypothetical protein [Gemmatimonadota bacterium]
MHRSSRRLVAAAAFVALRGGSLEAQRPPRLDVFPPAPAEALVQGPVVSASDMLAGARIRELLAAGFPARFHFRVELWSEGRWVNDLEREMEFDVVAHYIALEKAYEVVQLVHDRPLSLGKFSKLDDVEGAIARPTRVPLTAFRTSRALYYQVTLEVTVLSLSDLDELDRWLKGELQPAFSGSRNPGTALTRGFRALAARVLGGERREYERHTAPFRIP